MTTDFPWLDKVYAHVANEDPDLALDVLFDEVLTLLLAGEFETCDKLFNSIDITKLDRILMVGVLCITANTKLPSRSAFVDRVELELARTLPAVRIERLLSGLR